MTDAEKREAARLFCQKWKNKGKEDEDDQKFWIEILQNILGVEKPTDYIEFQKKVIVDGNTKRIDAYIPETRVIIEQKSLGISLDKKGSQSGGIELTPYEQAKRYNDNLPYDEKARWIITSNFAEIWVYDMNMRVPKPLKFVLDSLKDLYHCLDFLVNRKEKTLTEEVQLSIEAGEIIAKIYKLFLRQYKDPNSDESLKSLNKLCVRLVFCMYAEDSGLFPGKNYFQKYTQKYTGSDYRKSIIEVFKILNISEDSRDPYIDEELNLFPYVSGGLFNDDDIEIPRIDDELRETLKTASDFDWSQISPTIFGAVFESTLNPETRRAGGMHYTSLENIHKVIDPLFLDDLKKEFEDIKAISVGKDKTKALLKFQQKLSNLKFLDPACGSGNFLTETYVCLRRLENEIIRILHNGQMFLGIDEGKTNPIKVSIGQFYGIEINDFAVTVARTALWIAESQMMKETEDIVLNSLNFLPLKTKATIVEANALRIDWEEVVPKSELNYIMGNPPFVGFKFANSSQKEDMKNVFASLFVL
jgi:type I restriction-modification system DNA methylase subunit